MNQLSLFDVIKEVVLADNLKMSDYLNTSIVKRGDKLYIRQELKKKWPKGHDYEKYNNPNLNQLCEKCFKKGYINELDRSKRCDLHGRFRNWTSLEKN